MTIKDLENEYYNFTLNETLKRCSIEELEGLASFILCELLTGIRIDIYNALITEIEYRKILSAFEADINEEKLHMTIDLYKEDLVDIEYSDIKESFMFYSSKNISFKDIINWFPAGMSIEMCYVVYRYMRHNGMDLEQIRTLLIGNIKQLKQLYRMIRKNVTSLEILQGYNEDTEFINFMMETIQSIIQKMHRTESFNKMYLKLSSENSDVLKRLE